MDLLLQATGQASGGRNSVSGKPADPTPSSEFSRLLARQPGGLAETRSDNDLPSVHDSGDDQLDPLDRKSTLNERMNNEASGETDRSNGVQTDQKIEGNGIFSGHGAEGAFSEVSLAWPSMPGNEPSKPTAGSSRQPIR